MIKIKGEGLFVGEAFVGEGFKIADNLKKSGFKVTPKFLHEHTKTFAMNQQPKKYQFTFECESGNNNLIL